MNILVVSGGSGGHIYPSLSFIKDNMNHNIIYLGTTSKIESNIIKKLNVKYYLLKSKGLKKGIMNYFKYFYYLIKNTYITYKIIKKEKIDKIITFGGYSSSSVYLANLFLKKEIYMHEQNAIIGRNNKMFLKYVNKLFISFENTIGINKKYLNKVIYSGNPRILSKKSNHHSFNILIMTGSLGSSSVSNTLLALLDKYENIKMIGGINSDIKHTKVIKYIENMEEELKDVDLIITRAGATSLNEISSLGIPSIIIPSPYVVNNHQLINAKEYLKVKRGFLIEEKDLNLDNITSLINNMINNKFLFEEIKNNSKTFYKKDTLNIMKKEMNL